MTHLITSKPYELSDAELDAVSAGRASAGAAGLVALAVAATDVIDIGDVEILNNNKVTVENIANGNNVGVGVLINALGGPAAIRQAVG